MIPITSRYSAGDRNASLGISVTAGGVANTKGAYAVLIASTLYNAQGFFVYVEKSGDTNSDNLIDIAVGGAGAEQVILANLIGPSKGELCTEFYVPLAIPAGSRVTARVQSVTISLISRVGIMLVADHPRGKKYGRIDTYGAATADSGGTSVDPGATVNTKGVYSQIVASTTYDHSGLILAIGEQHLFVRSAAGYRVDIAVGGAGSEQIIVPDIMLVQGAASDHFSPRSYHFPIKVPAGSRLAVRAQCNINTANIRLFDAILYGVS